MLEFYPDDVYLYSKTGCKRVSDKVNLVLEKLYEEHEKHEERGGSHSP